MNLLVAFLSRPGMRCRLSQIVIGALWIGLACIFGGLALEASRGWDTTLPRSGFRIPYGQNVQIGNLRFQQVINTLAERYDQTTSQLEQSIRSSARRNFWLSLGAMLLSLLGFGFQVLSGWRTESFSPGISVPEVQGRGRTQLSFPTVAAGSPASACVGTHDGSFPDAGYAR